MQDTAGWRPVRAAATELGIPESSIRTAYRDGRIAVLDDAASRRKLVHVDEVRRVLGGQAPEEQLSPLAAQLVDVAADARRRAERAEQQVAFLRNELAQMRTAHARIQEIVDREAAERFQAAARAFCEPKPSRRGGPVLRLLTRRSSA